MLAIPHLDMLIVYVLYNQNRYVLLTILAALIAEVVVMISCLCFVLPQMRLTAGCLVAHTSGIFVSYWYAPLPSATAFASVVHSITTNLYSRASSLAFETLLFVLTLLKFYQSIARSFREQSIIGTFVRDGTWAFALIFGMPSFLCRVHINAHVSSTPQWRCSSTS
jgi:hypothetical protein